jgi:hypothetical protein
MAKSKRRESSARQTFLYAASEICRVPAIFERRRGWPGSKISDCDRQSATDSLGRLEMRPHPGSLMN